MKPLITALFIALGLNIMAQQISPEVIASAGDHFQNDQMSMSWTLGEPVIATIYNDNAILTQGFHQDMYIITAIDDIQITHFQVNLFPNPTPDYLNIEFKGNDKSEEAIIQVFDMNGRVLKEEKVNDLNQSIRLNLQSFERAQYFLKIIYENQAKTFKIVKS